MGRKVYGKKDGWEESWMGRKVSYKLVQSMCDFEQNRYYVHVL